METEMTLSQLLNREHFDEIELVQFEEYYDGKSSGEMRSGESMVCYLKKTSGEGALFDLVKRQRSFDLYWALFVFDKVIFDEDGKDGFGSVQLCYFYVADSGLMMVLFSIGESGVNAIFVYKIDGARVKREYRDAADAKVNRAWAHSYRGIPA